MQQHQQRRLGRAEFAQVETQAAQADEAGAPDHENLGLDEEFAEVLARE